MPKTSVDQWDATAGNNTDVGGINVDEGMSPGDVNNAIREMMAQLKTYSLGATPAGVVDAYIGTTAPSGWLLLDGATLGSAASTATNKSDDYQALYELLWNSMADAEVPVDGGRGASANADWVANKKLTMPDGTGRAIFGKEAAATRLTAAVSLDGATLGKTGGDQLAQNHTHNVSVVHTNGGATSGPVGATTQQNQVTANPNGTKHGGDSGNVPPAIVLNWIIKY